MVDLEIGTLLALALPMLGFVHRRIIGGVTGLVTGGPTAAVAGFLGGGQQQATPPTMPGMPGLPQGIPQFPTFGGNGGGGGGAPSMLRCQTVPPGFLCESVGPGWQRHPNNSMLCCPPAGNGGAVGTQIACPPGYRANKSSYFTKSAGWIEKGTKCVKARRRNPLNPRALDRAISRISSAKRASKKLGRITVRKKKC